MISYVSISQYQSRDNIYNNSQKSIYYYNYRHLTHEAHFYLLRSMVNCINHTELVVFEYLGKIYVCIKQLPSI